MSDQPVADSIELVTGVLHTEGVTYAVTGSFASSIHGEPITSVDVDIVARMTPAEATRGRAPVRQAPFSPARRSTRQARGHALQGLSIERALPTVSLTMSKTF